MEKYNRLFLLEDPGFDMDKWSDENYRSPEAMPKGNIQISTQLNAAYFGQPKLDKDALLSYHVPVKLSDGTWKADGTFADLLKAVYEGDNDVKDASADAAAEHRSEMSDIKIEDIISTMKLTHVPIIAAELELADLVPYAKSASSHRLYEAKQVGDRNQIEFGFGVAFPGDKERIIATRNGVVIDGENYEIIKVASGEGVAIKLINADGSDADAPVEGEVFAIYAEREVTEVQVIEEFITEQKLKMKTAQEEFETLKTTNEALVANLVKGKESAAEALAKATAELEKINLDLTTNVDELASAGSMDKVASLKAALNSGRLEFERFSGEKRTNTFSVANATADITASNKVIADNSARMAGFIETVKVILEKAELQIQSQKELEKAVDKASRTDEAAS